jgi:hypothetical protein
MTLMASLPATRPPATSLRIMARQSDERDYRVERVDEAAVVQVYADDFERRPLREKTLVWPCAAAAICRLINRRD